MHERYIAHVDRRSIHHADRQIVQFGNFLRAAVQLDIVLAVADLRSPLRQNDILDADCVHHIRARNPFFEERLRIEVHVHLPLLAAVWIRNRRARNRDQLRAQKIHADVEELLLGERGAAKSQLQNRDARRAVGNHQWWSGSRRRLPQNNLRRGSDLRHGRFNLGVRLKKQFNDGYAVECCGLNMLNVIDRGGGDALGVSRQAVGHFLRREPAVIPDHADHWNIYVRENVDRRLLNRHDAEDDDQHRGHNKRVRPAKC